MRQPVSLRSPAVTVERLATRAHRMDMPPRTLAQRYVEEGLRMDEHPLVRFADGPAGRRARLVGTGTDVWEVIAAVHDNGGDVAETASHLQMPLGLVQAAVTYYGAHPDGIDGRIDRNEREAAEGHAAWLAGQAALRRRSSCSTRCSPRPSLTSCASAGTVEAIKGHPQREALSDGDVMELARSQGRAIVTNNLVDFRPLHHEAIAPGGPGHAGMVFMPGTYRRTKADTGRIVHALEAKLSELPGDSDLANGETWL